MFLKEFLISRYGPLPDSGLRKTGSFNLFFGLNEEGKTLTIDALLKMLLGKGTKRFNAIKRVNEYPEGYLIIEDGNRRELKLPEAGTVEELFGLSTTEFSNIFVIRDSDLSISEENIFYRNITNRLTGLRSGEINEIKNRIYDLAGITAGGDYQNVAPVKLKDKIKKAHYLSERVDELLSRLQEEGFVRFEEELAGLEALKRNTEEKLNLFRAVQNRELYEKGIEALGKLKNALLETAKLKDLNQADYDSWQRTESSLAYFHSDLKRLEAEIDQHKQVSQAARTELEQIKSTYKKAEYKTALVSEKIEPLISGYQQAVIEFQKEEKLADSTFYTRTVLVSTFVFLLTLSGLIFKPSWWLFTLFAVSFALTVLLGGIKYRFLKKKGRLAEIETELLFETGQAGLSADNIKAVEKSVNRIKNDLAEIADQLNDAEKETEWQQKEQERLVREREEKLGRIKEAKYQIDHIRHKTGLDEIEQYRTVLAEKERQKSEVEKQKSILSSHFFQGAGLSSDEARIKLWEEQVAAIEEYADAAVGLKYDQKENTNLLVKKEELERFIKALKEKLQERSDELRDIEKDVNELLHGSEESSIPCQTTVDLEVVQQKLEKWIQCHEQKKANAAIALEILSSIEQEEEEKVTALFGSDNRVSEYFRQITGGCYREVFFESRENLIRVIRSDGTELDAYQLSGGAYDQLYFSIRLALGEKLLEGNKGFFILDDPFVKADPERLKLLLDMLIDISSNGWQILFFSAKGEVKYELQHKIDQQIVREFRIS